MSRGLISVNEGVRLVGDWDTVMDGVGSVEEEDDPSAVDYSGVVSVFDGAWDFYEVFSAVKFSRSSFLTIVGLIRDTAFGKWVR